MLSRSLLLLLLFSFWSLIVTSCASSSSISQSDIKSWCSQTPNPEPCEYGFMTNEAITTNKPIKTKSDFFRATLQLALHRTLNGQYTTRSFGPKCRNPREHAAWADCLDLYAYTIFRLNKTLNTARCTHVDTQTWLSTALTNLETCKAGFDDLGTGEYMWSLISNNNVTKLLSNSLALNYNDSKSNGGQSYTDGFPSWVKPGDRKLLQSSPASQANVVVAKDGSGKFTTVKDAVNAAPSSSSGRYVIYVKGGVYNEQVEITKKNIMLVGDGIGKTIITGSKSVGGGSTTFRSATVAAVGDGFIARDITFRNTAGASNHQAVAFRSGSDLSVFYKCGFEGYQDTLYVHSERQFYRECDIYGTVDFIFGNAAVVLQNCNIFARNPPQKTITVTAQGRTDPNQNTGIIIHNSKVTPASDLSNPSAVKAYLGRPWQKYSRTVFMKTFLDSFINPAGWMPWSGSFALDTLYYAEYANTGGGSSTSNRVTWKGYHVLTSASQASPFTVGNFIAGNSWLPATNVPFTSGL